MRPGAKTLDDRLARDAVAPLGIEELLDPCLGPVLRRIDVIVALARQELGVLRERAEPGRLQEVARVARVGRLALVEADPLTRLHDALAVVQIVEPPVVLGRRVGRPPHAPVGRPAHDRRRIAPTARRQRVDDGPGNLHELVDDREGHFQGEHACDVLRRIERTEQHLALHVGEAQGEFLLGDLPRPRLSRLEPREPGVERRILQLLAGVAHDHGPRPADAVRPLGLHLGHDNQLHEDAGGLARPDRPHDPVVEQRPRQVVLDEPADRRRRRILELCSHYLPPAARCARAG